MTFASLEGKNALVTGASKGIGRAIARELAAAGASVVLGYRSGREEAEALAQELGGRAVQADVSSAEEAARLVAEAGDLDVLVNNAGLNVPRRDMAGVSTEDWHAVLQANLTGTFLVTRAVLPVMRGQGGGTVVNVSSMAGYRASALTGPAYNAAKAGVNSFTDSLNMAERVHGIRACAVCPGEVATPILERRPQPPTAEARATMLQPEDLADTVLFVATLPQRATVELLTIYPTVQRDWTGEVA